MRIKYFLIIFWFGIAAADVLPERVVAGNESPPGVVIAHSPASAGLYIGSPALCVLPDGSYVAAHDCFGPAAEDRSSRVAIFRSQDGGRTWTRAGEVLGQTWSSLFVHRGDLYLIGPCEPGGDLVIRRSCDGGATWTVPVDGFTGRLFRGRYHSAPTPVVAHEGRIWKCVEDMSGPGGRWARNFRARTISAEAGSDLLRAASWTISAPMGYDSTYLNGKYGGWLEGNAVIGPDGGICNMLRTDYRERGDEKAALLYVNADGRTQTFDKTTGFVDLPGACKKFTIRFDETSGCYWTLANYVPPAFRGGNPERTRNTVALLSSYDLVNWDLRGIALHHPDVEKHGCQYLDFLIDGDDLIAVARTAWDDAGGGADNQHNANYLTFHRIHGFRRYETPEEWVSLLESRVESGEDTGSDE